MAKSREALDGARLHREALVIDGLRYMSDGDPGELLAANIAAINLTISHMEHEFEETCDEIAVWLERLRAPDSGWLLVETAADIRRARAAGKVGLIMGWQNMRVISDKLSRIDLFHKIGVRIMQLTYNSRNFIGDGCLEKTNSGLSAFGRRVVQRMNEVGVAIDLSHVGEATALDAAEASAKPVLLTHANAHAVRAMPRNKSDALIRAVARSGGIIGVSIYGPMCWDGNPNHPPMLLDFLRHLDHVVELAGIERVGFGTDLPAVRDLRAVDHILAMTRTRFPENVGAYEAAFGGGARERYLKDCGSSEELVRVTEALAQRGWKEAEIRGFLGENLASTLDRIWAGPTAGNHQEGRQK